MTTDYSNLVAATHPAILFVFPLSLHGAFHGNVQGMLAIAADLHKQGYVLDLVYRREASDEHPLPEICTTIFRNVIFTRDGAVVSNGQTIDERFERFHAEYPPSSSNCFRPDTAFTMLVRALIEGGDYVAVVANYVWTAPIFVDLARRVLLVCDTHDIMSEHAASAELVRGEATIFSLPRTTEEYLWQHWDVLIAVTERDRIQMAPFIRPHQRLLHVSHAYPCEAAERPGPDDDVLYAGSDNYSNVESLIWFLREVWPRVLLERPAAHLRIAGLIGRALPNNVLGPGVECLGVVPDLRSLTVASGVVIAPYLYGSGLKIKVVEAACAGKAIVTSPSGVAGSGLKENVEIIVADDAPMFAAAIVNLVGDKEARSLIGRRALAAAQRLFSPDVCYGALREAIAAGLPPPIVSPSVAFDVPDEAIERLIRLANAVDAHRLTLYGNGSHTQALRRALALRGRHVQLVIDRHCHKACTLDSDCKVIPLTEYDRPSDDLVILSSKAFEAEMWRDLYEWRESGTHITAVYDHGLVTPALLRADVEIEQRALLENGMLQRVALLKNSGRFFICDSNIRSYQGHYLGYANSLADVAEAEGIPAIVAGHHDPASVQVDRRFIPAFTYDGWTALVPQPGNPFGAWHTLYAEAFSDDLIAFAKTQAWHASDVVFLPTANLVEVSGVARAARRLGAQMPCVRLLFRFGLADIATSTGLPIDGLRLLVEHACWELTRSMGEARVGWLTDSRQLSAEYTNATGLPFTTAPIPVFAGRHTVSRRIKPARLVYLGDARPEKGFAQLTNVVNTLDAELCSGHVALIVQCPVNPAADAMIHQTIERLSRCPGVTLIHETLGPEPYEALLASADLILLPYQQSRYVARTSGVLAEAITAGVPVVVPANTWLSSVLQDGHGAGITFGGNTGRTFEDAVRSAWVNLNSLHDEAVARRSWFAAWHTADNLLTIILGAISKKMNNHSEK